MPENKRPKTGCVEEEREGEDGRGHRQRRLKANTLIARKEERGREREGAARILMPRDAGKLHRKEKCQYLQRVPF